MVSSAAYTGLAILATAAGVVLAALAVLRTKSPLALPLALLALNQFAWNGATVGLHLTGDDAWRWVGATAAPLFLPFALHFTLVFVGRRRALNRWLLTAYAVFGAQALGVGISAVAQGARATRGLSAWAGVLACTIVPLGLFGFHLVLRHLDSVSAPVERLRTWLLLLAFAVVAVFATTDLLYDVGLPVPPLSHVGSFAFNTVLGVMAFRLGLLADGSTVRAALLALLVGLGGAAVALFAFMLLQGNLALLALAFGSATLVVVVVTRRVTAAVTRQREGLSRAANLGRFSAQMAHDLKNPIAAAHGAVQFLEEEARQGRSLNEQAQFLTLLREQLERMTTVVDRYQRLAKVQPALEDVDVAELVKKVLALQAFAGGPGLELRTDVPSGLPRLPADPDLLGTALENLVKNALDALPQGKGVVTVGARVDESHAGDVLRLSVADTGSGMDARAREQAFEPFFTTKAAGTGLGLPWVQEVARAHGGTARLQSREGSGTVVELVLPLKHPTGARDE